MHTLRNRIFLFSATMAAGLSSLALYRYMMANCIDDKGLLITGNLPGRLLWVVGVGFAAVVALMLLGIGGDGSYADNFPRCLVSGGLMIAAGAALAVAVPDLVLQTAASGAAAPGVTGRMELAEVLLTRVLPYAAAGSMAVLGVMRIAGRRPVFLFGGIVCLFYMLMLVNNYRLWSADPQLHDYAYQLLAGVLLMLCSFHRTCCDAGIIQRRRLIATGLTAAVCCMTALASPFQWMFYLASGLWAVGSLCNVAVLPPDPEPEEEAQPEPAEAPENAE